MSSKSVRHFAESFKTEDHLRQCLRTLFSRMPDVRDVEITHGTQELGKDIIFYVPNFLQKPELYACVVKQHKIDGTVGKHGAREVLYQALQAFDSPHINTEGQEDNVTKVIIISPYDCPPTTMNSIKGELKHRAGQTQFLCGSLLMDEFSKHWKDFLLFESSALNTYIASIARHLMDGDPIHFILRAQQLLTGELESLEARYVDQNLTKPISAIYTGIETEPLQRAFLSGTMSIADLRGRVGILRSLAPIFSSRTLIAGFSKEAHDERTKHKTGSTQAKIDNSVFFPPLSPTEAFEIKVALADTSKELVVEIENLSEQANKEILALRQRKQFWEAEKVNTAEFALSGRWSERNKELLERASGHINAFIRVLKVANELPAVKGQVDPLSLAFSAYIYVKDVARELPSFFSKESHERVVSLNRVKLLNSRTTNLLITAPAGYGKTSFCKVHAVRDAVDLSEKKSERIPVYIPLSTFATRKIKF